MSAQRASRTRKPKPMSSTPPLPPPPTPKSRRLEMVQKPGQTEDDMVAELVTDGDATNASTAMRFVQAEHGEVSLTHMVAALRRSGEAVNAGDLSGAERMLNSQAVALNAIFAEMARRAALNMGEYLDASERYMRLALKAQGQCRATVETLAAIKNPPVLFARQANINNGGQQQVNNGQAPVDSAHSAQARAQAGKSESEPNKLLETCDVERMDAGAPSAAGSAHQNMEAVGAVDWPEDIVR